MDIRFCYRISADAQMAFDTETGNPTDTFLQVKLGEVKNPPADYDKAHKSMGEKIANEYGMDPEWVTPISTEEYDRETESGEDEEDY